MKTWVYRSKHQHVAVLSLMLEAMSRAERLIVVGHSEYAQRRNAKTRYHYVSWPLFDLAMTGTWNAVDARHAQAQAEIQAAQADANLAQAHAKEWDRQLRAL